MDVGRIVVSVLMFLGAAFMFVIALRQLACKGCCFNNAYIYASKKEREERDFTPYYKQSGRVLLLVSSVFVFNGLYALTGLWYFTAAAAAVMAAAVVYAVASSARMEKKNTENKEK